ncbi:MAG: GIY-YIG nuclease family protein [Bacteroidetes bacterium]|nr:GIY-YIG nuclease family protein [Bacteroidota bacterium]MBL0020543.1 GIY-YIG nuclease family protein [Bacteroidota bacterium]
MYYYTYITTNPGNSVLYTGMTNDLRRRLTEHKAMRGSSDSFAGKYYCYKLVYFERHLTAMGAIRREKEIKKLSREDKIRLIASKNPKWEWLNSMAG